MTCEVKGWAGRERWAQRTGQTWMNEPVSSEHGRPEIPIQMNSIRVEMNEILARRRRAGFVRYNFESLWLKFGATLEKYWPWTKKAAEYANELSVGRRAPSIGRRLTWTLETRGPHGRWGRGQQPAKDHEDLALRQSKWRVCVCVCVCVAIVCGSAAN